MQEGVSVGVGAMAAVLGKEYAEVKQVLQNMRDGVVEIANWNSRDQIVIAGHKEMVEEAVSLIDAPKTVMLPVSAPFHCQLMLNAEQKLAYDLDYVEFKDLEFPIITNVDAKVIQRGEEAREALKRQVSRTVLWYKSMQGLEQESLHAVVELGVGNVLSGLMKRISRSWEQRPTLLHAEDPESLEKTRRALNI